MSESLNADSDLPLVVSAGFDCNFIIWDLNKEGCLLKQFYLYNKINYLDISETSFLYALGLQFTKNEAFLLISN